MAKPSFYNFLQIQKAIIIDICKYIIHACGSIQGKSGTIMLYLSARFLKMWNKCLHFFSKSFIRKNTLPPNADCSRIAGKQHVITQYSIMLQRLRADYQQIVTSRNPGSNALR